MRGIQWTRRAMLCLAWIAALFQGTAHSAQLFDVDVRIESASSGQYRAIVEKITPAFVTKRSWFDSLVVSCPTRESRYWRTVLHRGERLPMSWSTRGSVGTLALPEGGWTRECTCDRGMTPVTAALQGEFIDGSGVTLGRELACKGASRRKRIATLGIADAPKPPARVRIRCGWAARGALTTVRDGARR